MSLLHVTMSSFLSFFITSVLSSAGPVAKFRGTGRIVQLRLPHGFLVAARLPRMEQGAEAARHGAREQLHLRHPARHHHHGGHRPRGTHHACRHRGQVSSLGKAKCVNMYAGCFTTDSANITLFFEYSAPRECFNYVG